MCQLPLFNGTRGKLFRSCIFSLSIVIFPGAVLAGYVFGVDLASDDMDGSGRSGCCKKEQVVIEAQECREGRAAHGLLVVRGSP